MISIWPAMIVLIGVVVSAPADAGEQVVLRAGDIGAERQLLSGLAEKLMQVCQARAAEAGGDACAIEDQHLYVGRHSTKHIELLLAAVDRPYLCDRGGCRLWMFRQNSDDQWQMVGVGAVDDFAVNVSDSGLIVLFGTYSGARWEDAKGKFQTFCVSGRCMADFEIEDPRRGNAIVYPDPLSTVRD